MRREDGGALGLSALMLLLGLLLAVGDAPALYAADERGDEREERADEDEPNVEEDEEFDEEDEDAEAVEEAMWERLEQPVSVELRDASFAQAMAFLRKLCRHNLVVHQETAARLAKQPVTLVMHDTPLWTVLTVFARSLDLRMVEYERTLFFAPRSPGDEAFGTFRAPVRHPAMKPAYEIRLTRGDLRDAQREELIERLLEAAERTDQHGRAGFVRRRPPRREDEEGDADEDEARRRGDGGEDRGRREPGVF